MKDYEPAFVWGQLIGWFKQTVDKPNASLSADRRGTLSYPDLESFTNDRPKKKKLGRQKANQKKYEDFEMDAADGRGTRSRPLPSVSPPTATNDMSAESHHR